MNKNGFLFIGTIAVVVLLILIGMGYLVYKNYIDVSVDVALDCSIYKDQKKIDECCRELNKDNLVIQCVGDWIIDDSKQCKFECAQQVIEVCTQDAKICPDGSFVSRNPNNDCEFNPCP